MGKLKEMAPVGIFFIPGIILSFIVIPLAIFAPVTFCASIDPSNELMDGWGGSVLRTLFFHCSWVGK